MANTDKSQPNIEDLIERDPSTTSDSDEAGEKKEEGTEDPDYVSGEFDNDYRRLNQTEPFLGGISMNVTKIIDNKMPTAYIGVRPNGKSHEIVLAVNSKFFRSMSNKHRTGVLKHELYHMIFQHIFSRAIGDVSYHTLWNWATDLAINSIIGADNLPRMVLCPGVAPIDPKTGKDVEGEYAEFIKNAPPMMSSDWYFEKLREIQDKLGDSDQSIAVGTGMGSMDDHGKWSDIPAEVEEQIRNKVREMIGDAVKRADGQNSWGSVPSEIQADIRRLVSNEVDWRSIVRSFVGRTRTMERNSTVRKINKKMPYMFPGVRRPLRANFACFIDQSGSMSDDDIALLFGELENFSKLVNLDVFHFDTQIDEKSHTVWKKGMAYPNPHRTRCGGTDFQAVADFCNKPDNRGKWSGVVILTDGYAPVMGPIPMSKVLWVVTESGTMEHVRSGDLACKMKADSGQFKTR